jgi:hypothetical protein
VPSPVSARGQRLIACNGVAERCSNKHIRRKMSKRGDARKADDRCETVSYPRHPAVVLIPAGYDRGDRKNTGGVPRWEGTPLKGRLAPIKECIVKRSSGRNITRSFPAGNCFHRQVDHSAVSISLPGEYCRTHLIRVMPSIACNHERNRKGHHFGRGNRRIKDVVDVVEVPRMRTKVGHRVRIGHDESRRARCDGKSGQPVAPLRQLRREQPNAFLIVEKVFWQRPPRHLSIPTRVARVF